MHHRFVVSLDELTFAQLADRAERERRGVREQATLLLERVLKPRPERHGDETPRLPVLASQTAEA